MKLGCAMYACTGLSGCIQDTVCTPGYVDIDGACVAAVDAGSDAGGDAGTDAGPCGTACIAPTSICDATSHACVACLTNPDCAASSTGHLCDTAAHTCVACLTNTDCTTAAASRCDPAMHTCTQCSDSNDCTQITGAAVCDTASATHTCVACTAAHRTACGTDVCDGTAHTCTTGHAAGSKGLCQTCVADAECMTGMTCIEQHFPASGGSAVGKYCLHLQSAAPSMDCFMDRPYVRVSATTSVDGASVTVCDLRSTTCPGLNDFSSPSVMCAPGTPAVPNDGLCGAPGFDDAYCKMAGATTFRCTTPCLSDDDCKMGVTCNSTVTPNYCNLM